MLNVQDSRWRKISAERTLRTSSPIASHILEKVLAGKDLDANAGLTLSRATRHDLAAVVKVADEIRALIRTIGRTLAERTTTCKIRRVFERADLCESLPAVDRVAGSTESSATGDEAAF